MSKKKKAIHLQFARPPHKLTFADVLDKPFTIYDVSRSGSIAKYENVRLQKRKIHSMPSDTWSEEYYLDRGCIMAFDASEVNKSTAGLNEHGNIHISWGHAVFLDKKEAQDLALKIVNTKHENSVKKIMSI
jgi:hypothetical protein